MKPEELMGTLVYMMKLPSETEWVEFKEAKNNFDFNDLGEYFSALSNEANIKRQKHGWLIFGIKDKPRHIVGTNFRSNRASLDSLKHEIAMHTTNRVTFEEIYELPTAQGRVILFQIPAALRGTPTAWKGHYFGRDGESKVALNISEIEAIRGQGIQEDWSAKTCPAARLDDLDPDAMLFARQQFKKKHGSRFEEMDQWDDLTFLNKAKICIAGQITNTALVLLGREQSTHHLSPGIAQITWVLRDEHGIEKDYQHFESPLILAVDRLYDKVRNLTYRYLSNSSLFPTEITQYDPWVLREILHNCIAHQDYTQPGRINVVEEPESLLFTNMGSFMPGSIEEVILRDAPPEQYRNPFLAQAMVNLNMIDTIGSGIKRMFLKQKQRFFPMPDYDLTEVNRVKVRLYGKILDEKYTRLLIEKSDVSLADAIALDKIQKRHPLTEDELRRLRQLKFIEGRRPNLFVSAKIAAAIGKKAAYIKQRSFDKEHYKKMVISYLETYGEGSRKDFDELLFAKISDALNARQKAIWIRNLLQEMRRDGLLINIGSRAGKGAKWSLSKNTG